MSELLLTINSSILTNFNGDAPLVVSTSRFLSRSWLITGFVTRVTRWVPLVAQELLSFRNTWIHRRSLVICVVVCRSSLSFFIWSCVSVPSSIYGFWFQTLLQIKCNIWGTGFNVVLCKTSSVLLCVLQQLKGDNFSVWFPKRGTQLEAFGPIGLRPALIGFNVYLWYVDTVV
jgi:hypothetical protein